MKESSLLVDWNGLRRLALRVLPAALACSLAASTSAWAASAADRQEAAEPALAPCPATMGLPGSSPLPPVPPELAASLRARLKSRFGPVSSVCRTPFGLYEIVADGELFYVDERANYLLTGAVFDLRTREDVSQERKEQVLRVDFASLPTQWAVKTVRGDGTRQLAVFEDPNCPYCKRFEHDIATLDNATIYTFLFPILSRDAKAPDDSYAKSRAIWCAPDRTAAWAQVMRGGKRLPPAAESCSAPLEQNLELGRKLHISGTPTLVFADGRRAPGLIPLEDIEKRMTEAARASAAAEASAPAPAVGSK